MRLRDVILRDTRALQPAASAVDAGVLYGVTDEDVLERSNGTVWEAMGGSGTLPPTVARTDVVNTFAAYGSHEWVAAGAGAEQLLVRNPSADPAAEARLVFGNDVAAVQTMFGVTASTQVPLGELLPDSTALRAYGNGGLSLSALRDLRFYTGLTLRGTLFETGGFSWGDTVNPGAGNVRIAGDLTVVGTISGTVAGGVPATRTINGHALTADIVVTQGDVGLGAVENTALSTWAGSAAITTVGTLAGLTVTAPIVGSVTGNAATATVLQTARAINGVSFNGSADVTVAAAAGTLTGTALPAAVVTSSLTRVGASLGIGIAPVTALHVAAAGDAFIRTDSRVGGGAIASSGWTMYDNATRRWDLVNNKDNDFKLNRYDAAGAFQDQPFAVSAGGTVNLTNLSTPLINVATVRSSNATANSQFLLSGAGLFLLQTGSGPAGVGLDVATDAVLKVRTRAQTGYATVDALAYRKSGVEIDTEPAGFYDAGNSGTAKTLDWNNSRHQRLVLTGNVTFTLANPLDGARYVLHLGTGAGGFTGTWPAAVKWAGGVAPVLTATASKTDVVVLIYASATGFYYGAVSQAY